MTAANFWDEAISIDFIATPPHAEALTEQEMSILWQMFSGIVSYWGLEFNIEILRSRWIDMIEALCVGQDDCRGEFAHAARVFRDMVEKLGEGDAISLLYGTIVTKQTNANTRLAHVKFYVVNDFIRCFVATGGFRGFVKKARNYTGFMGGSRFREWPPVRTGAIR